MKSYTPPTIRRLHAEPCNPFRLGSAPRCAEIDGVPVERLARDHGSPLFVFSETALREKIREARRVFERRYPDVRFAWSYKTNYLNAICRVFHEEGAIAEVVSEFEYEKARGNGVPGRDIIFNGPCKGRAILERAVEEDAMIQVDNLDELLLLGEIAARRPEPVAVALRVHLDTGTHAVWSKFGFNADNGEALRIVRRLMQMPGLRLQGFHAHIGTFILEPGAYRKSAEVLVRLALAAEKLGAGPIRYLNLGGGFASRARLHHQYLPPEQATPGFDRYAEAICDTITQVWPAGRLLPRLYLETGRALVDEAGYLISTVVAVKHRPMPPAQPLAGVLAAYGKGMVAHGGATARESDRPALVIDAGVNLLYTTAWYQPTILPARACTDSPVPTTVYGCLCMNIDVVREEAPLPGLTTGDHVVLHPVGAYNITQSMQFIAYRPAIVMIAPGGQVHVIRRRENLDYIQELEEIPGHLVRKQPLRKKIKHGSSATRLFRRLQPPVLNGRKQP
ncbi:MAG: alanine racemase [Methylacidiphilales bacterium]|nr:alanine racemase [Candidatus Methylacidiphilales bacterium]